MARKAIIDLGTNTFNILIGEVTANGLHVVHAAKVPVMLGMDGINEGRISKDAYDRAMDAMRSFYQMAKEHHVDDIRGIATSAVRGASNGQKLVDDIHRAYGINIDIINGQQEAELIYKGVKLTKEMSEPSVIMDIGGGSTEFIFVQDENIQKMVSLNIGVSRLFQLLDKPDNFSDAHHNEMRQYFEEKAGDLFEFKAKVLIGASGSFETIWEMIYKEKYVSTGKAHKMDWEAFNEVLNWSIHSSLEEREAHPWIVDMRKRMLPIGAMKIKWIIEKLGIEEVWVSPYSLKEGALVS